MAAVMMLLLNLFSFALSFCLGQAQSRLLALRAALAPFVTTVLALGLSLLLLMFLQNSFPWRDFAGMCLVLFTVFGGPGFILSIFIRTLMWLSSVEELDRQGTGLSSAAAQGA